MCISATFEEHNCDDYKTALTVQLKVCSLTPPAQWSWRHLADKQLETFSKV